MGLTTADSILDAKLDEAARDDEDNISAISSRPAFWKKRQAAAEEAADQD